MISVLHYFYRLVPANPILLRVVEAGGKRWRDLVVRCLYLGLLIFFVIISLATSDTSSQSLAELAKTSATVFQNLSIVQLALVSLLAPVFTAGAITQEKDSQTYDILLATPLNNGQIVLGSLLSRLFFVIALLISGVPVFAITQIFGGVAIHSIVMSFAIAAVTALVTGALAMAIATFKVGTRRTIFSFYMFIVVYLVGLYLLDQISFFHPVLGYETDGANKLITDASGQHVPIYAKTGWLTAFHPFLALRTLFFDKNYTPPEPGALPPALQVWPLGWLLARPASFYVSFMLSFSLLCITPSIIFLRRLAQSSNTIRGWIFQKLHLSSGERTRKPRPVWNNPIAWREAKTKASAARATVLRYGFISLGLIGAIVLVYQFSTEEQAARYIDRDSYNPTTGIVTIYTPTAAAKYQVLPDTTISFHPGKGEDKTASFSDLRRRYALEFTTDASLKTLTSITLSPIPRRISEESARNYLLGLVILEFSVVLLIITNAAASTVTREKEDGSLDLLLATPITSRYYIWGKLRGLVYFVLPLVAVPVASILLFIVYDLFRVGLGNGAERWIAYPESIVILPAVLVIVTAFAGILGMQMSLRCRTTVMAVMSSVGIVIGLCAMLGWCGYRFLDSRAGSVGLIISGFSPFTAMTVLINPYSFAESAFSSGDELTNRLTIFISSIVAVGAYTAVVWRMYTSMVTNFDMTIRKQAR